LVVEGCTTKKVEDTKKEEEQKDQEPEVVEATPEITEDVTEGEEIPVLKPITTTEVSLTKRPGFWIAMVVMNIIIIGAVVFFIVKAVGKKTS